MTMISVKLGNRRRGGDGDGDEWGGRKRKARWVGQSECEGSRKAREVVNRREKERRVRERKS